MLTFIDGTLNLFQLPLLLSVDLSAVAHVGDALDIEDVKSITSLTLPALTVISGSLGINKCPSITSVAFPALTYLSSVSFALDPLLALVSLPVLKRIHVVGITADTLAVAALDFPLLSYIQGNILIKLNNALTSVSFPKLTSFAGVSLRGPGELAIYNNTQLATLSVPSLKFDPAYSNWLCWNGAGFVVPSILPPLWTGKQCRVANGTACPAAYTTCA